MVKCRICDGFIARTVTLRENMFGRKETFEYAECGECGCLQICEMPADMASYYPENYYSYASTALDFRRVLRTFLTIYGPKFLFGRTNWWQLGAPKALRDAGTEREATILDVGCGGGDFIAALHEIGFRHVAGIDPFIPASFRRSNGVEIEKRELRDVKRTYDFVMMNHSLEHVWDQHDAASQLFRILNVGGKCVIRVPTISSWCWDHYGADWVQADAPRHFYLHSRRSITLLLQKSGLHVVNIVDDSIPFGISGSENIRAGKSLVESPHGEKPDEATKEKVRKLNAEARGDAIAVHAIKPRH